jgi:hypothetical protein
MPLLRLMESQVSDFTDIANRLASFEGYKHVILLSQGFSPGATYRENGLTEQVKSMARAFRAAGAVVDAVDVSGVSGVFRNDASYRDPLANDVLHLMARETGGQFVEHANDVGTALNRISTDSAVGYRLGFKLPKDAKKGDNTIDVKVHNVPSGTTLSFRRGFSTTVNKPSAGDTLRLADVILNDVPQTGIAPQIRFVDKHSRERRRDVLHLRRQTRSRRVQGEEDGHPVRREAGHRAPRRVAPPARLVHGESVASNR